MRLVIDGQILQTSDFLRGMGFYLRSVFEALPKIAKGKKLELFVVLNSNLPKTEESLALVQGWFPEVTAITLALDVKTSHEQTFRAHAPKNRQILTHALKKQFGDTPYTYFLPAQFAYDIFTVFPDAPNANNVLLFHDLIPYLYSKQYFASYTIKPAVDYCERFSEVFAADMIVTNSQTTADDLMVHFCIDRSRLRAILGSGAPRSSVKPAMPKLAGLTKDTKFIFMPSGDDRRKNNFRAVQAFARAAKDYGKPIKMVVGSRFSEGSRKELEALTSDAIIAAHSFSDAEMLWLIDHAKFTFFPTEYEGLGMPILEAMARDAAIVCSDISVFREISIEAMVFCDPLSVSDMAATLLRALRGDIDWMPKKQQYAAVLKQFSWEKTATLFWRALEEVKNEPKPTTKKKIAIHAPSPDSYSSVGKYAMEVHAELSRYFDIDYFLDSGHTVFEPVRLNILQHAACAYPATAFDPQTAYDAVLYHMGASEFGINTLYNALRRPDVALVHDCFYQGLFDYMLRHNYITQERFDAEQALTAGFNNKEAAGSISYSNRQRVLLHHSAHAKRVLSKSLQKNVPFVRVQHPGQAPEVRIGRGNSDKIVVSLAGIISPDKGLDLLKQIATLDARIEVRLFGFGALGHEIATQELTNVTVLKDLSDLEFQNNMRTTDILVNYRLRYFGETSRTTIEAMRYGVPVIVRNVGWYAEQPDDAVVKVESTDEVMEAIKQLVNDDKKRQAIGDAAYSYAKKTFDIAPYIATLRKVLEENA